jgi:undecaprenyl diphosphate synthase
LRRIINASVEFGIKILTIYAFSTENWGRPEREVHAPESLTESLFSSYLFTRGLPDPDLVIRTSGELRISNFLIWQAAYSEFYPTPVYWPDFGREEPHETIVAFNQRERRFGLVTETPS